MGKLLTSIALASVLCGCAGPRPFRPTSSQGREIFDAAHREIFPEDVRRSFKPDGPIVVWAGRVLRRDRIRDEKGNDALRILIEHHYFDWVDNRGSQPERYFVSPRGDGLFGFIDSTYDNVLIPDFMPLGAMVAVMGIPKEVALDGTVVLDMRWTIRFPDAWVGTDIADYGRKYLLEHDLSDYKQLREIK